MLFPFLPFSSLLFVFLFCLSVLPFSSSSSSFSRLLLYGLLFFLSFISFLPSFLASFSFLSSLLLSFSPPLDIFSSSSLAFLPLPSFLPFLSPLCRLSLHATFSSLFSLFFLFSFHLFYFVLSRYRKRVTSDMWTEETEGVW